MSEGGARAGVALDDSLLTIVGISQAIGILWYLKSRECNTRNRETRWRRVRVVYYVEAGVALSDPLIL